jgi:hypothetical protein
MDTNELAQIMQDGFPDLGFSISDGYPGATAYDKLVMENGATKPSLEEIEAKASELQELAEKQEQRSLALKNKAIELGLINA